MISSFKFLFLIFSSRTDYSLAASVIDASVHLCIFVFVSGRAQKSSENGLMNNRTIVSEDDPLQENMKLKASNISSARNKEKIKVKNNSDSSSLTRSETVKSSAALFGSENCTINLPEDFSKPQTPLEDS